MKFSSSIVLDLLPTKLSMVQVDVTKSSWKLSSSAQTLKHNSTSRHGSLMIVYDVYYKSKPSQTPISAHYTTQKETSFHELDLKIKKKKNKKRKIISDSHPNCCFLCCKKHPKNDKLDISNIFKCISLLDEVSFLTWLTKDVFWAKKKLFVLVLLLN